MLKLNLLQCLGQSGTLDNKGLVPRRLLTERHAYRRQKQTPKQERASRHHYKYANYEFRTRRINPRDVACVPSESVRSFAVFAGSG